MNKKYTKQIVKPAVKSVANMAEMAGKKAVGVGLSYNHLDPAASRTVASRQRLHDQVDDEIASFLAHGGQISQIEPHVTADPPRKPLSRYGQRPI